MNHVPGTNGHSRSETATASLSPRQERVAVALAAGMSIEGAAKKHHCAAQTVKTWLRDKPAFRVRIRWLRTQMTERAVGLLIDGTAEAAWTLRHLLKSKSETMRLKAADAILNHAAQMRALVELSDRIADIEAKQAQLGRKR